jgi:outer membrane protein OmpA-like peptidoglycan-associated protein
MVGWRGVFAAAAAAALAGCATSKPPAPARVAAAPPPGACAAFSFPIYFDTGSTALSPAGRQVVEDAVARVRGCRILQVEVLGLADAGGSVRTNLAVSRRRAASVAAALAAGLPQPRFDIEAAGESGAITPEGRPEPLRRRADVVIRAAAPAAPPRR